MCVCYVAWVVSDSATLWTIACQDPLSMEFSRQEYWSGLPCPPPGDLPDPGIQPASLVSCIGRQVLYHSTTWQSHMSRMMKNFSVVSDSLQPHGLWPFRLPCPWNSPGKNNGIGNSIKTKSRLVVTKGSGEEGMGVTTSRYRVSVWGKENGL